MNRLYLHIAQCSFTSLEKSEGEGTDCITTLHNGRSYHLRTEEGKEQTAAPHCTMLTHITREQRKGRDRLYYHVAQCSLATLHNSEGGGTHNITIIIQWSLTLGGGFTHIGEDTYFITTIIQWSLTSLDNRERETTDCITTYTMLSHITPQQRRGRYTLYHLIKQWSLPLGGGGTQIEGGITHIGGGEGCTYYITTIIQ